MSSSYGEVKDKSRKGVSQGKSADGLAVSLSDEVDILSQSVD